MTQTGKQTDIQKEAAHLGVNILEKPRREASHPNHAAALQDLICRLEDQQDRVVISTNRLVAVEP